jgi:DNA-binding response OmpR family regulator
MSGQRILVVDDEEQILRALRTGLRGAGYEVETAATAESALVEAAMRPPDGVILDLVLPDGTGTEVCRELRKWTTAPIIILSAVGEEREKIAALDAGADDYVTKPFSIKVLLARVASVMRRADADAGAAAPEGGLLRAGPLSIDTLKHEVAVEGETIKLTLTEFKLLAALVQSRGRVLTRDQLMDKAMGTDVFVTDRAIDVHITAIRKKLGSASWLVHTVRGVGYRLRESPEETD